MKWNRSGCGMPSPKSRFHKGQAPWATARIATRVLTTPVKYSSKSSGPAAKYGAMITPHETRIATIQKRVPRRTVTVQHIRVLSALPS